MDPVLSQMYEIVEEATASFISNIESNVAGNPLLDCSKRRLTKEEGTQLNATIDRVEASRRTPTA